MDSAISLTTYFVAVTILYGNVNLKFLYIPNLLHFKSGRSFALSLYKYQSEKDKWFCNNTNTLWTCKSGIPWHPEQVIYCISNMDIVPFYRCANTLVKNHSRIPYFNTLLRYQSVLSYLCCNVVNLALKYEKDTCVSLSSLICNCQLKYQFKGFL